MTDQKAQKHFIFRFFSFILHFAFCILILAGFSSIAFAQETASLSLQAPSLSLPIIIGFGLIDSINPCVIGVLLLMLAMLLKTGDKKAILRNGIAYTVGVYLTYLVGGLTLLSLFNAVRGIVIISQIFYFVIGAFVLLAGMLEVKDYFWYGKGFSLAIPHQFIGFVEKKVKTVYASMGAAIFFGFLVTLVELPCTGAPYLAILTLMSQSGLNYLTGLPLLLLYNLIFVAPLLVIIYLAYAGIGLKRMEGWRQEHRGLMRLFIGLALLALGVWIITTVAKLLFWPLIGGLALIVLIMAVIKLLTTAKPFEHRRHKVVIKAGITKVEKRTGAKVAFDEDRLVKSLAKALHEADQGDSELAEDLAQEVIRQLDKMFKPKVAVPVENIRMMVGEVLAKHHLMKARHVYLRHRYH